MSIIIRYVSKTKNGPVLWLGATATAQLTKEVEALEKERVALRGCGDAFADFILSAFVNAKCDNSADRLTIDNILNAARTYRTVFPKQP